MKAIIQNLALAGLVSLGAGFAVSLLPSIDSADLPTREQGPSALEASSVELAIDGMSVGVSGSCVAASASTLREAPVDRRRSVSFRPAGAMAPSGSTASKMTTSDASSNSPTALK